MGVRGRSTGYSFWMILLAVLLAGTSLFLSPDAGGSYFVSVMENELLSHLLAFGTLALIAVSLTYVNSSCYLYTSSSGMIWGSYLAYVFLLPGVTLFTEYHAATLLVIWGLYFLIQYVVREKFSPSLLFLSLLTVSLAALLVPALVLLPFLFVYFAVVRRPANISKVLLTVAGAMALPILYLYCIGYIFGTVSPDIYFHHFLKALSLDGNIFCHPPVIYVIYILINAVLIFRIEYVVMRQLSGNGRVQKNSFGISFLLLFVLAAVCLLYHNVRMPLILMVLFAPLSFSVHEYFQVVRAKEATMALSLFFLFSAALRLYQLIF